VGVAFEPRNQTVLQISGGTLPVVDIAQQGAKLAWNRRGKRF
jgi:hypothetical protein